MRKTASSGKARCRHVVELAGRREVAPERLLDHDPRVRREADPREALDHVVEQRRRDGEVEERPLDPGRRTSSARRSKVAASR